MSEETAPAQKKRKRKIKGAVPRYYQLLIPFPPEAASAINDDLSRALGEDYGFVRKRECYKNSILAASCLEYQAGHDAHVEYVEGWLVLGPDYAIEHGWLEVEQEVVDVTLAGQYAAADYYAVYRYAIKHVTKLITAKGTTLPLFSNHVAGIETMKEAFMVLPINHDASIAMACLGYLETKIKSVIIPEGVFLERRHEPNDRD